MIRRTLLTGMIAFALAGEAHAQAPVSYAVTYLELKARDVAAGRAILKAYGARSQSDSGNLLFEVLEETARPSRFAILEAWRNRGMLDAHFQGEAAKQMLGQLVDMRSAPDDRRIYDAFAAERPVSHADGLFHVMTHVDVMPPFANGCADLLKAMRPDTLKDHGNVSYDVLRLEHEPNHFTVAEVWASKADFEAHLAAAHTVAFRQKLLPMTGALYDERLFRKIR